MFLVRNNQNCEISTTNRNHWWIQLMRRLLYEIGYSTTTITTTSSDNTAIIFTTTTATTTIYGLSYFKRPEDNLERVLDDGKKASEV